MLRGQLIEYKKRKHIVTIMSDLKSTKKADLKLKKADLKLKDLVGGFRFISLYIHMYTHITIEQERCA